MQLVGLVIAGQRRHHKVRRGAATDIVVMLEKRALRRRWTSDDSVVSKRYVAGALPVDRRHGHVKTIVLSRTALKQFAALPLPVQKTVESALDAYAVAGRGDVKLLTGSVLSRLRVGRYRIIFAEDKLTILAIEITKRDTTTYKGPVLR